MSQSISASIIVTSYNQEVTLRLLLASLERQTYKNFEVVIADDGSSDGTAALCKAGHSFPIRFVTQEDQGYRKARILNRAIKQSQADYLLFLDGDVILEPHFVQDHIELRKPGHFVCGRRVDLGAEFSQHIQLSDVQQGKFDSLNLSVVLSGLKKDTQCLKRGLRVANPFVRKILGYDQALDILGSNFSAWKSDIEAVNGFNEGLESYWGEDGDLYIRLRNIGKKAIGAKSLCIQYHVFHKRRAVSPANEERYRELLRDTEYRWAEKGYRSSE